MSLLDFGDLEDYQFMNTYEDLITISAPAPVISENHAHQQQPHDDVNKGLPAQAGSNFASSSNNETLEYQHQQQDYQQQVYPQQDYQHSAIEASNGTLSPYFQVGYENNNGEMAFPQSGPTPPLATATLSFGDLIASALTFADAGNCDACKNPFTDENGPEVFSCGHMVCRSCYLWCQDLSHGRCDNCNKSAAASAAVVQLPTQNQLVEAHVPHNSPMSMSMSTMTFHAQSPPKHHEENVAFSFPTRIDFTKSKEKEVVADPAKTMYSADTTVDVDFNESISAALDFLDDVKDASASPSSSSSVSSPELKKRKKSAPSPPKVQVKPQPQRPPRKQAVKRARKLKIKNTEDDCATILIGTETQIQLAVQRQKQAQKMGKNSASLLAQYLPKYTGECGHQGQKYYTQSQALVRLPLSQKRRSLVLLPICQNPVGNNV